MQVGRVAPAGGRQALRPEHTAATKTHTASTATGFTPRPQQHPPDRHVEQQRPEVSNAAHRDGLHQLGEGQGWCVDKEAEAGHHLAPLRIQHALQGFVVAGAGAGAVTSSGGSGCLIGAGLALRRMARMHPALPPSALPLHWLAALTLCARVAPTAARMHTMSVGVADVTRSCQAVRPAATAAPSAAAMAAGSGTAVVGWVGPCAFSSYSQCFPTPWRLQWAETRRKR